MFSFFPANEYLPPGKGGCGHWRKGWSAKDAPPNRHQMDKKEGSPVSGKMQCPGTPRKLIFCHQRGKKRLENKNYSKRCLQNSSSRFKCILYLLLHLHSSAQIPHNCFLYIKDTETWNKNNNQSGKQIMKQKRLLKAAREPGRPSFA